MSDGGDDLDLRISDDELAVLASAQLSSSELQHYEPYRADLLAELTAEWASVRRDIIPCLENLVECETASSKASKRATKAWRRVVAARYGFSGAFALFGLIWLNEARSRSRVFIAPPGISGLSPTQCEVVMSVLCIVVAAVGWWTISTIGRTLPTRRALESATQAQYSVESRFIDARRLAVTQALRRTINRTLGATDALIFPTDAPALVEVDSAKIIDSKTVDDLLRFIRQHTASAIGLAGPRGVGKTTILRRVTNFDSEPMLGVILSAPVKYDPVDFTRRLFSEILKAARHQSGERREYEFYLARQGLRRQGMIRLLACLALATVGAGAIYLGSLSPPVRPNAYQMLGFSLLATSLGLFMLVYKELLTRRPRFRYPSRGTGDPVDVIERAERVLHWREEVSTSGKTAFKPLGGLIETADEDSHKDSAIDISHAELVTELREFLRDYQRAAGVTRIVIAVDELDKLAKPEFLIDAVNGLKDLFHIEGTHFVVSVSTDALDSFALRGVPARDAFDSSFDTIVSVQRLSANSALELMESRSTGFPAPLVLFCHAWSGGLPRDLLRTARMCVDTYAQRGTSTQETLVRSVIVESATRALASYARSRSLGASGAVRLAVQQAATGELIAASRSLGKIATADGQSEEVATLQHHLDVAAEILDEYAIPTPLGKWNSVALDSATLARSDALSTRMAAVGDAEIELLANVAWGDGPG